MPDRYEALRTIRKAGTRDEMRAAERFGGEVCDTLACYGWARQPNCSEEDGMDIMCVINRVEAFSTERTTATAARRIFMTALLTFEPDLELIRQMGPIGALGDWNDRPGLTQRNVLMRCRAAQRRIRDAAKLDAR